jgi:hypothetical protein
MLSFIYRLAVEFEQSHEVRPNLLYLHPRHLEALEAALDNPGNLKQVMDLLQMDLVLDAEIAHPRVGWSPLLQRKAG